MGIKKKLITHVIIIALLVGLIPMGVFAESLSNDVEIQARGGWCFKIDSSTKQIESQGSRIDWGTTCESFLEDIKAPLGCKALFITSSDKGYSTAEQILNAQSSDDARKSKDLLDKDDKLWIVAEDGITFDQYTIKFLPSYYNYCRSDEYTVDEGKRTIKSDGIATVSEFFSKMSLNKYGVNKVISQADKNIIMSGNTYSKSTSGADFEKIVEDIKSIPGKANSDSIDNGDYLVCISEMKEVVDAYEISEPSVYDFGGGVTGVLSGDTLVISKSDSSGNGKMKDFGTKTEITPVFDTEINNISIGEGVKYIGKLAFFKRKETDSDVGAQITGNIVISNDVEDIGESAFSGSKIKAITLGNGISTIGERVFSDNQISNIKLVDSVESLGNQAFYNNSISTIDFGKVKRINEACFAINKLKEVNIPNCVEFIDSGAFSHNELEVVTLNETITSIENSVFMNNKLKEIVIPANVKTIKEGAFDRNELIKITIGKDVEIADDTPAIPPMGIEESNTMGENKGFKEVYEAEGKMAGVYIWNNSKNKWEKQTVPVVQTAPTASGVTVSGTTKVGETLTGNYTYNDADGDIEGTSTFKWYRANDNVGAGKTEIAGSNAKTYTLQASDLGKYIGFEVTPVATTGIPGTTIGTAKLSGYTSAVVAASSGGSGGSSGSSGSGGGGATTPTTPTAPKPSESGVIVIVNGEKQIAGTEYVTEQQGIKQVEVKVDTKIINQKIDSIIKQPAVAGRENVVEVPIMTSGANRILTSLNGDSIKKMDVNDFDLSLVSQNISYKIPAKEINIDELAKTLNMDKSELQNMEIQIRMDKVTDAVFKEITSNAEKNNYQLVLKPVEFTITAKKLSGEGSSKSVTVSKFNQYVQREFEIPSEIDPTKITTGIVYNEDGTFSHIPTTVFVRDGKYYARLNSLTNSKYSVIWNPIEVKSVEKHWAKAPVNDMASRLIIKDIDSFEPNKAITRGDFAEYITKAIGIYRTNSATSKPFSDIELNNSLADAIAIASEYGIINGYPDGTFRPNETITREEAMSMYAKAMEITDLENIDKNRILKYKDKDSVSKWAYSAVQSTIGSGVFNGRTADKIEPKGIFTYAEAATAIRNLLVKTELINEL